MVSVSLVTVDVVPLARQEILVGLLLVRQVGAVVVLVPSVVPLAELNQLLLSVRARAEVDHETERPWRSRLWRCGSQLFFFVGQADCGNQSFHLNRLHCCSAALS